MQQQQFNEHQDTEPDLILTQEEYDMLQLYRSQNPYRMVGLISEIAIRAKSELPEREIDLSKALSAVAGMMKPYEVE